MRRSEVVWKRLGIRIEVGEGRVADEVCESILQARGWEWHRRKGTHEAGGWAAIVASHYVASGHSMLSSVAQGKGGQRHGRGGGDS